MGYDCVIDHDQKLITVTGCGVVSMDARYKCLRNILNHNLNGDVYHALFNVSHIQNHLEAHELLPTSMILQMVQDKIGGRIAIVNTHVGHATTSQLIALTADRDSQFVRAFLNHDEAMTWLFAPSH